MPVLRESSKEMPAVAPCVAPESNLPIDITMANLVTTDRTNMSLRRTLTTLAFVMLAAHAAPAQWAPIIAEIEPYGIAADGTNDERVLLRIEEEPTGRLVPLLPYIFFDEGLAEVPARYRNADSGATSDPFVRRYRTILAIIGARMREHPAESLVITGASSMTAAERRVAGLARR
jgi:hypothetical protein